MISRKEERKENKEREREREREEEEEEEGVGRVSNKKVTQSLRGWARTRIKDRPVISWDQSERTQVGWMFSLAFDGRKEGASLEMFSLHHQLSPWMLSFIYGFGVTLHDMVRLSRVFHSCFIRFFSFPYLCR